MVSEAWDIVAELVELDAMDDEEKTEQVFKDTWEALNLEFNDSCDAFAKWRANKLGSMEAKKAERDRLNKLIANDEATIIFIEKTIESMMRATDQKKINTDLFSFNIQKNGGKAKLVKDEGLTPKDVDTEYISYPEPVFNNEAIREALESGVKLGWAHLERGESLRIK